MEGEAERAGVFEEVLLPHLDSLYSLARRLTRNADVAADLLQETALRALQKYHQLRNPAAARSWLSRILTTIYLNDRTRREPFEDNPDRTEPADDSTPESALLRRCDAREVEAALAELPAGFRVVVLLADVEELPLREIAEICGCPIGTIASRLARGRRSLQARLASLGRVRKVDA